VLIGLYVATWATSQPPTIAATVAPASSGGNQLTLETVAAIGPKYSPTASRLGLLPGQEERQVDPQHDLHGARQLGRARHDLPVRRRHRPAQPLPLAGQGTVGGTETIDGKTVNSINPEEASHTFVVPQLGVFVPLPGVPEEAKNQCEFAPCEGAAHRTIEFSFYTGQEGPLPLAVLRAVRRRLPERPRRPDADARLHGRVPQCRLARRPSPARGRRTQPRGPLHGDLGDCRR
jgi:hypothetical protein